MFEIEVKKKLHSSQGNMVLDIALQIEQGKFISLYGKSGAGKTTLLKMLAGLIQPDKGSIKADQEIWFSKERRIDAAPQKRKIGFVFQDYALFPNMTIQENLEFVLPDKKIRKRISEILNIMGLTELSSRYPSTLSGGQQQRVALARALVREPELLLLDEPLSSLDYETRFRLQDEIIKIHRYFSLTTILISHDPSEIYRLSDTVIELDFGKIVKKGLPSEVFQNREISGKVQLMGEILAIERNDVVFIAKVISGNNIMKIIVTREEALNLKPNDTVLITSKAFSPVIIKLNNI
ncbi:MAG TPA: ATP-binding cassette domain-containing protein [Cytophagaceae bacterium]|nr:ATP-binding cassette domain-containing protein [Cytophagaceae bacterium]